MKKEIIILGKGPSRDECPFNADVWGVNDVFSSFPNQKFSKIFFFDYLQFMGALEGKPEQKDVFVRELNKLDCEVVCQKHYDEIPKSIKYPLREILEEFKIYYFTNSVCYVIAYAIFKGYKTIRLYGVDQMGASEYLLQKGGVEAWLSYAMGLGIEIRFSKRSNLFKTEKEKFYGYNRPLNEIIN